MYNFSNPQVIIIIVELKFYCWCIVPLIVIYLCNKEKPIPISKKKLKLVIKYSFYVFFVILWFEIIEFNVIFSFHSKK